LLKPYQSRTDSICVIPLSVADRLYLRPTLVSQKLPPSI
jgi:hypothetical protein